MLLESHKSWPRKVQIDQGFLLVYLSYWNDNLRYLKLPPLEPFFIKMYIWKSRTLTKKLFYFPSLNKIWTKFCGKKMFGYHKKRIWIHSHGYNYGLEKKLVLIFEQFFKKSNPSQYLVSHSSETLISSS